MRAPLLAATAVLATSVATFAPVVAPAPTILMAAANPKLQTICVSQTSQGGSVNVVTSTRNIELFRGECLVVENDGSARVWLRWADNRESWKKGYAGENYTGCHDIARGTTTISNPLNTKSRVTYKTYPSKGCPVNA